MKRLILGTRGSPLALAQTEMTRNVLAAVYPELQVEVVTFVTRGDRKLDLNLLQKGEGGGKGLFTRELEEALLDGRIDVAVHSLKDLPGHNPEGLEITAVLERAPTADVLIGRSAAGFESLAQGAVVGTSSIRRARQIQALRPDVNVVEWRGNVQTRLRKLGQSEVDAIVLAQAGLERLGFSCASGSLSFEQWTFRVSSLEKYVLPAIGQGAVALQSALGRGEVAALLARVNHGDTMTCVRAERALQRLLSGDCSIPVGVRTLLDGVSLSMEALLFSPGSAVPAVAFSTGSASEPELLAERVFAGLQLGIASSK
jgi:hydroxymethylbilane synthase